MSDSPKIILITGCSPGGIGNYLAREFHARGLRVFPTARKTETISDLSDLGMECLSLVVDDPDSVVACYREVEKLVGDKGLDYLFNNAGRNYTVPALDTTLAEIQATFATNLFSIMHINSTFAPLILRARGSYVHTGSIAGIMPYLWGSTYNASKAALHSYCNTLRVEMAPFGIKVIETMTGGVKSNIARTYRELPETSLYQPLRKQYQRRLLHSQELGMDTETYAKQVVGQVLGAEGWFWNTTEIWAGTGARPIWWVEGLDRIVPGGVWKYVMRYMFGLGALKEAQGKKTV